MKKIYILIFAILIQPVGFAREKYTALQAVYDLGLLSMQEPFLANRNSARLPGLRQYQVGLGIDPESPITSTISVAGPIQYNLAIGIVWSRSRNDELLRTTAKLTQFEEINNRVMLSFGHRLFPRLKLGHQAVIQSFTKNERLLWDQNELVSEAFRNTEFDRLNFGYQIGLLYDFSSKFKLALLSPLLCKFSYLETRIARFETKVEKEVTCWGQKSWQANLPEIALEIAPIEKFSAVAAMGKKEDTPFFHSAAKIYLWNRLVLAAGFDLKRAAKNQILLGTGTYFGGFHGFYSYNVSEKNHQLALSFSPQQEKKLIRVSESEQKHFDIFLYKLDTYRTNPFISGTIKNITDEPVSLHLELEGDAIYRMSKSLELAAYASEKFNFNLPAIKKQKSGATSCRLRITAFQRGKQFIEQAFPIRLWDAHHWNGEPVDLPYFVQPDEPAVFELARRLVKNAQSSSGSIGLAETVFDHLSRHLKYIGDPTLNTTDYVQWPQETLQRQSGDCEDLSVLYCSLLGAMGIPTALVEIRYPENKTAHIFVLFNTGRKPGQFNFPEHNPNRFVCRKNKNDKFEMWLPLEITMVGESFEKAWQAAAMDYYFYGITKAGLAEGWVKIVDVF